MADEPSVLVWTAASPSASTHVRQLQPAFAMLGAGADVRISYSLGSRLQWSKPFAAGVAPPADARVVGLEDAPEFDVVVVHSPFEHWVVDVLEHLRKAGIRIVVDVDDVVDAMENLTRTGDGSTRTWSKTQLEHGRQGMRDRRPRDGVHAGGRSATAAKAEFAVLPNLVPKITRH